MHNILYLQKASICIFVTIKIDGDEFKEEEKHFQILWLFCTTVSVVEILCFSIFQDLLKASCASNRVGKTSGKYFFVQIVFDLSKSLLLSYVVSNYNSKERRICL